MKSLSPILFFFLLISCRESPKPIEKTENVSIPSSFEKGISTNIGETGFTIDLPQTHKIEERKGPDFAVYYITPIDTNLYKGGAGIYFGANPDEHGPESAVSRNVFADSALNKNATVTTYITPTYTWIETLVNESDSSKIQFWYFANDSRELGFLGNVMKTLDRVKNDSLK